MPYSGSEQIKVNAETLFSATSGIQSYFTTLSQSALSNGTTLYQKGNYAEAAKAFRRAISFDPSQENAVKAYKLMATAYIADNKKDDAIKAYKSSLKVDPSNDATYVSLGNIYFNQGNYTDALKQYEAAAKISPTSSANAYTLGQGYLAAGRHKDAENQFQKVIRMSPHEYSGYYGLGQTYSKQGRYEEAVSQFDKVLNLKYNFSNARVAIRWMFLRTNTTEFLLLSKSIAGFISSLYIDIENARLKTICSGKSNTTHIFFKENIQGENAITNNFCCILIK